ncbi:hypothetical protein AAC387_Pa07g2820 [Persea americana]
MSLCNNPDPFHHLHLPLSISSPTRRSLRPSLARIHLPHAATPLLVSPSSPWNALHNPSPPSPPLFFLLPARSAVAALSPRAEQTLIIPT